MNWYMYEVEIELRQDQMRNPSPEALHRWRWDLERRQQGQVGPRALIGWLGGRLVRAGERLQAWSAAGTASRMPSP
jgi:hypothetical protein